MKNSEQAASGYGALARPNNDGTYDLSVMVDGVHCAACIQKIESALITKPDIKKARLNFSTRRLSLNWQGAPDLANDYINQVETLGYDVYPFDSAQDAKEGKAEERFLLMCLGVAGFAMGNIMLISVGVWTTSAETMGMATRDFMHLLSAMIGLPALIFSGRPFFRSAWAAIKNRRTNMDVPISLALILAGGMSLYETMHHGEHVYFDSAVMLMFFLLIGRYLDFRARKTARTVATDLMGRLSGFAMVVDGDRTYRLPVGEITENMKVRVAAGEKFPVDGFVIEGRSEVDTALVTGETIPSAVAAGDEVYAGTINLSGPVMMRVSKPADDSLLADIIRLLEKAEQGQSHYTRLADRAARFYTPAVHSLALLAFAGWWGFGGMVWQDALLVAITVLIITCPCALGLAVPVAQVLANSGLMKKSILIKSGEALERLAAVDTVLFDKTGTLTMGRPQLEGHYTDKELQMAASLAAHSTHPLSKALTESYDGPLLEIGHVREEPGKGLEGFYKDRRIRLGNRKWCGIEGESDHEKTELCLVSEKIPPVIFYFTDHLKSDAKDVIKALQEQGLSVMILSGDREQAVAKVAKACGVEEYYAGITPPEKYGILEELKRQGHQVLMVGDGLNDAPVLAAADISMAPGTAIDLAQNAADIVFMGAGLSPVKETLSVAKQTQKTVKQNFMLAVLYNIIAVPVALAGLVTPFVAAIAMSGSSLIVIANSFRLKKEDPASWTS